MALADSIKLQGPLVSFSQEASPQRRFKKSRELSSRASAYHSKLFVSGRVVQGMVRALGTAPVRFGLPTTVSLRRRTSPDELASRFHALLDLAETRALTREEQDEKRSLEIQMDAWEGAPVAVQEPTTSDLRALLSELSEIRRTLDEQSETAEDE